MSQDAGSDDEVAKAGASLTPGEVKAVTDMIDRLTTMSHQTNLMAIESTLRCLEDAEGQYAAHAASVRAVARRMVRTTKDFRRTLSRGD